MTAKQMQKEIDKLENGGELSPQAQRRLRDLKNSIIDVRTKEQRSKRQREAFAAKYGETPKVHREPADTGLEGPAWINFFNRYCDPQGLAQAKLIDAPAITKKVKKEREVKKVLFSFNNRTVHILRDLKPGRAVLVPDFKDLPRYEPVAMTTKVTKSKKLARATIPGFTFGLAKALEFITTQDENRLVEVYGEKRALRLQAKLPAIRQAVAQAA